MTTLPTEPTTSAVVMDVGARMRAGEHVLVTGPVGDWVLVMDRAMPLPDALEELARPVYDVVVRVNVADGIRFVKGEDRLPCEEAPPIDEDGSDLVPDGLTLTPTAERERRLRALRRESRRTLSPQDPATQLRHYVSQPDVSVFVLLEQAEIFLQDPAHHDPASRLRLATTQMALREACMVGGYRNTIAFLSPRRSGIPETVLESSEDISVVPMGVPTLVERAVRIRALLPDMHDGAQLAGPAADEAASDLARQTEGISLQRLAALAAFSRRSRLSVNDPRGLVSTFRHGKRPDHWSHLAARLGEIRAILERQVFGQPAAIDAVMRALSAAALRLNLSGNRHRFEAPPRGVFFFVGPTGVGKNELAAAIALALFGDEEACTVIEMSTMSDEHAVARLIGSPTGYVGYSEGGQLTNAALARPNGVILLDEIEKAHPRVFDHLLPVFDSGRLTDNLGRTAFFGDTIIVMTSNIGADRVHDLLSEHGLDVSYDEVRDLTKASVRSHFLQVGRPEMFGRLATGVIPFDVLRPEAVDQIADNVLTNAIFENGPRLEIDLPSGCAMAREIMSDPDNAALGGRMVAATIGERLFELAAWVGAEGHIQAESLRVHFEGLAMQASVDGAAPVRVA